ncbi:hypothetical protein GCM10011613_33270 [Cellvibrio zantedeschiae]|uniref:Holin of 3TMs, for gene-transfer release n=1 Tax=Cellvibrio zantedeschiae TaxID=1237077 RepID=A0ABQ3BA39_9GAMM|nr:3TM-type holin [Cellvibrio zantedeschiae]GGY85709.1 hypothetical protein GCM10011613_33270 [Cellvibrio zantedeschiae]
MNFLSTLFNGGNTVKAIGDTVDNLFTSDEERLEKQNEFLKANREFDYLENKLIAEQNTAQAEVNKTEATHTSLFVAGWRPAIGWVGALALFYQFILYPLLCWIPGMETPPTPNSDALYPLIMGMLGIGTLRSFDKLKGTDTKSLK